MTCIILTNQAGRPVRDVREHPAAHAGKAQPQTGQKISPPINLEGVQASPIRSLQEAIVFLERWPYGRRTAAYQEALNLVQKAALGYASVEEARVAFRKFAVQAHILAGRSA
jgi:hypothetical protein